MSDIRKSKNIGYTNFEAFEVVRREVIGRVEPDPDGNRGPLEAAFTIIAGWMPEHLGPEPMSLEFSIYGRVFRVTVDDDSVEFSLPTSSSRTS